MKVNFKVIFLLTLSHVLVDITGSALPAFMPLVKEKLYLTFTAVGMVIMTSNLTSSVIQPIFGYISDKMSISWILPLSILFSFVGISFFGFSPSYLLMLFLVILNGIGIAAFHPEGTKVMHYVSQEKKATIMAIFQVGGNIGLALGPLLATFALRIYGLKGTFLFLFLCVPLLPFLFRLLKERSISLLERKGNRDSLRSTVKRNRIFKSMAILILSVTMRSFSHAGFMTFIPFYFIEILNGEASSSGRTIFVFLLGGVVGTIFGGIIADRIGHKKFFSLSMVLSVPLLSAVLYVKESLFFILLFFSGLVLMSSFSVTIVMGQAILKEYVGIASGLMMGFVIGMGGIGAGIFGFLIDLFGIRQVMQIIAFLPGIGFLLSLFIPYGFLQSEEGL